MAGEEHRPDPLPDGLTSRVGGLGSLDEFVNRLGQASAVASEDGVG